MSKEDKLYFITCVVIYFALGLSTGAYLVWKVGR